MTVEQHPRVARYEQIKNELDELQQRITRYEQNGVDVSGIRAAYEKLEDVLATAEATRQADDRPRFIQHVEEADGLRESIGQQLDVLSFELFLRENWLEILLAAVAGYTLFFLVTMVAIPYFRLRTEYLSVQQRLSDAVSAREKAERQYFKREIDRETFMKLVRERHDQVLGLRSERDRLEEELSHAVRSQLTPRNVVLAPIKAFREVRSWIESYRSKATETKEAWEASTESGEEDNGERKRNRTHKREHGQQYYDRQRSR